MKKTILNSIIFSFILSISPLSAQEPGNISSELLGRKEEKLVFGGYGQVDFSKPITEGRTRNSLLDVSRLILSMAYNFTPKTSFFSEIEFEHVRELYVEQAFLNHSFNDYLNFRAGLMLVPMGIINEYHEPTTFNGVNRPSVDNLIVPTTWREIGFGFTGRFMDAGIRYQVYLFNGFSGYDGTKGLINGEKFLREARQKGAKSFMTSPDFSAKIDYFGIPGLKLGLSGYFGKTESALYKDLDLSDEAAVTRADSSMMGIAMTGIDARYSTGGLSLRGEFILSFQSNTSGYNSFTGNDAGSMTRGMYAEVSYDVLNSTGSGYSLVPFFRYENYDTHFRVEPDMDRLDKYRVNEYVFGLGWKLAEGAMLKADMQLAKPGGADMRKTFNAGIGLWF